MALAYAAVLAAALVPYLFIFYAKFSADFLRGGYNRNPREYEAALGGARQRAVWAQDNGFEAFPPFAAAVLCAGQAGADPDTIALLAMAFVGLRVLYGVLYVADLDKLRSIAWFGGLLCVFGLFALAVGAL